MFLPNKSKATLRETIGTTYIWLRRVGLAAVFVSGLLFQYVNPLTGFITVLCGYLAMQILDARKHLIFSDHLMDENHNLRMRLIDAGDQEYVLERMQADRAWYGMPENPQITEQLNKIRNDREEIKTKLEGFLTKLVSEYGPKANDEGKN